MYDIVKNEKLKIENMIYEVRGKQVMLDRDLAKLYGVETKRINEAVKNNSLKFPERFSWILTKKEYENLRSKFSTSSLENTYGGRRYSPRVFTEQGVAMLSTILKSKTAIQVSITIMDAFVMMRKYISSNNYAKRISNIETKLITYDNKLDDHDNKFKEIFDKLDTKVDNHIFFEGQIYDAYSLLIDILNMANKRIVIIDNYINKNLLDIISKIQMNVILITSNKLDINIKKYQSQYSNLQIKLNNTFHDRFIIIDDKILYHCGASFKDLGKKCFALTKIKEEKILQQILAKIV